MPPEDRKLLQQTLELEKENNSMLHKIRRVQKWSTLWQSFKVVVIIAITLGAFYYVEPYLNKIVGMYNTISGNPQSANDHPISDFLNKITK